MSRVVSQRRGSRRLELLALAAAVCGLAPACSLDPVSLASFLGQDFTVPGAEVLALDGETLEPLLTEAATRYRMYADLPPGDDPGGAEWLSLHGGALPIGEVLSDAALTACAVAAPLEGADLALEVQASCALSLPATGRVTVRQTVLETFPNEVIELELSYDAVEVTFRSDRPPFVVDGAESIVTTTSTGDQDGADLRTLQVEQDGLKLDYTFRFGLVDGETPVFDYEVPLGGDVVGVRLTNPQTPGALATALVQGADGTLVCEIRNTAWAPGEPARGTCDNGASFGLPTPTVGAD